jgi:hypothetical protein
MIQATSFSRGIFSALIVIALFSILINGCKKASSEKVTKLSINNIHNDPLFQDYVVRVHSQYNSVQNFNLLSSIMKDGKITNEESNLLHSVYGYNSKEEFHFAYVQLSNIARELWKKYDFNSYTNEEKKAAVIKTYEQIRHNNPTSNSIALNFIDDDCEKIRQSCILSTAAQATLMHIGCGVLDIGVILGVTCHSAAILYQKAEGDKCNAEADKCKTS